VLLPGAVLGSITFSALGSFRSGFHPTGELVADYVYAAFLALPVQNPDPGGEAIWSAATVAAGACSRCMRLDADLAFAGRLRKALRSTCDIVDEESGVIAVDGLMTAVVDRGFRTSPARPRRGLGRPQPIHRRVARDPWVAWRSTGSRSRRWRRRLMVPISINTCIAGTLRDAVDARAHEPIETDARPDGGGAIAAACGADIVTGSAMASTRRSSRTGPVAFVWSTPAHRACAALRRGSGRPRAR